MGIYRKSGGSNVAVTPRRRAGNSSVVCANGYRRSGGTWAPIWTAAPSTSVTLDRSTVGATGTGPSSSGTVGPTTPDVVASGSPAGGTYSWARLSGDASIGANNAASNGRQNWTRLSCLDSTLYQAVWRCTYTVNGQSASADVTVNCTWFDNR